MWIFFYIFFIFTAITILPIPGINDYFWIPKELIFNVLGFCFIATGLLTNSQKNLTFKNKWLGIILIYCALSFGWYFYMPLVMTPTGKKVMWNLWVIRPFINICLGLWIIQTLVEHTDSLLRWIDMSKLLCWMACLFSIYTIIQLIGLDPIFNNVVVSFKGNLRGVTLFGNTNLTANFLAVISPLCLIFKGLRYKIIYALCFVGIILTDSSLSLVAFVLGLFIYLLFNKKWKLILLLFISSVLLVLIKKPDFFSFSYRFRVWEYVLEHCKNTLWLGKGLGNFAINQYKPLFPSNIAQPVALSSHCEPLQILHDGGIIMFSLVMIYILDLFKRIFWSKQNMLLIGFTCAFISYLIICLGNFPLRIAPLALVGIIYISAIEAIIIKGDQND